MNSISLMWYSWMRDKWFLITPEYFGEGGEDD